MQKERASKKQQELLSFVDGFIKGNGYGPSYREIMRALGYKSVSTVAIHIDALLAKGYLRRKDNSARSLEVVTTRSDGGTPGASASLEEQLLAHVKRVKLDSAQLQTVKAAMELLGFTKISEALEPQKETTDDVEST